MKHSEDRTKLREANKAYTECISRDFLGRFLAGEAVSSENFCIQERDTMKQLDEKIYGKL